MNRLYFFIVATLTVVLCGCGDDQGPVSRSTFVKPPAVAPIVQQPKKETVRYAYRGDRFRDPFVAISAASASSLSSDDVPVPTLGGLTLKGIILDGKQSAAIISAGSITYVLKGRRLYDNRQRLVKGITGVIGTDSVLIIGADKSSKELRLREKP